MWMAGIASPIQAYQAAAAHDGQPVYGAAGMS